MAEIVESQEKQTKPYYVIPNNEIKIITIIHPVLIYLFSKQTLYLIAAKSNLRCLIQPRKSNQSKQNKLGLTLGSTKLR